MRLFPLLLNAGLLHRSTWGINTGLVHPIGIPTTQEVDKNPGTARGALVRIQSQTSKHEKHGKHAAVASDSSEHGSESMADTMQDLSKCPPGQMCDCACNCHKMVPFFMGKAPTAPPNPLTVPPPPPPPPPPTPPEAPLQIGWADAPDPPPLIPHEGLFEPMLSPALGGRPTLGPPEPGVPGTLPPGPSTGPPPTTTGEPTAPPPPTTTLPPPTTTLPLPTVTKKEWWTVPPASTTPWWWPGSIWATTKAPYPWWWDKPTPEQEVAWKGGHNIRGTVGVPYGPYDFPQFLQAKDQPPVDKAAFTGEQFEARLQEKMLHDVNSPSHTGAKSHTVMNSPTGQAIFLDESAPGFCNCPACPQEPKLGAMPWETPEWGNPWDKFMTPQ